MTGPPGEDLPPELLARLFLVEGDLLVGRYRQALDRTCGRTTRLERFWIDAVGYSPQVAAELSDPLYLGRGVDHPAFIVLTVDQLTAPIVQPNAGFSAWPFRQLAAEHAGDLTRLTLEEPVLGEISHGVSRFVSPCQLPLVGDLTIALDTPSGRVKNGRALDRLRATLVESDWAWRDDRFIEEMAAIARAADGFAAVPEGLSGGTVRAGPCYVASLGGCYVLPVTERPGYVLCRPSDSGPGDGPLTRTLRDSRVVEVLLDVDNALSLLHDQGLVEPEPAPLKTDLSDLLSWLVAESAVGAGLDPGARGGSLASPPIGSGPSESGIRSPEAGGPESAGRTSGLQSPASGLPRADPSREIAEIDDILLRIGRGSASLPVDDYLPITRLRLLRPRSSDPRERAFVRHMQAGIDPANVPLAITHAPDLLFGRFPDMEPARRTLLRAWLAGRRAG